MLVETVKDQICINQVVGQKKETLAVEGDVIVNDVKPDVLNIISTSGTVCIYKKEIMEGKIRIDGSINTYVIYLADGENQMARSLNTVLDFTHIMDIDNVNQGMNLCENINIKNFECKVINSRKISVKVILELDAKVYSNENVEVINKISDIEDIQMLSNNRTINLLIGDGSAKVYAKDTITLGEAENLAEIMKADFKIIDKDIKVSYNKILAKAETDVNIMYLTEDNRINSVNTRIPIMGFIEIPNIKEDSICDTQYKVKNIILKPNNLDEHSIYIEAEIEIMCFAYETRDIEIIEDLYSISSDIQFNQKEIITTMGKENISKMCNIKEQIDISELNNGKICSTRIYPNVTNTKINNGKINYEGEVKIEFLIEANRLLNTKTVNLPINFTIEQDDINENSSINTDIEIKTENFIVVSDEKVEIDIGLEFNLNLSQSQRLNIIDEISLEEYRQNNIYSMVIYFVKPGDTLWKIAKKFKSTIEDIARINNIEDINKIYTGEQLYIPKYVRRSIAV